MARPSAASSRIEPRLTLVKATPSHSPQARRPSTARRLFRASALISASGSFASTSSFLPSSWISPSAAPRRIATACGSPSATSAAIAAMRSSPSPFTSLSTAARSSASAGKDMKKAATKAAFLTRASTLHLLVGHQRRLVLLLVVARDERAPRLRLDRSLGLPHHVELAVGLHFADEYRLVEVVVLLIHLGGNARRRLEG